jgi:D-alanyl-D-alanine carboxypeptidase/D-alanyl-D-alanine-endopeptidase (penicillin-binding protein 4)
VETYLQQPELAPAHWGILLQADDEAKPLYARNAGQLFVPASNVKLLTTAAALVALGPDYQFQTPVYGSGQGPVLRQLRLVAQGDPSLSEEQLRAVAETLKAQGVSRIQTLILEDSSDPSQDHPPTWEWDDLLYGYAPPINRAILNQNQVALTLTPGQPGEALSIRWSDPLAGTQFQVINRSRTALKPSRPPEIKGIYGPGPLIISGELVPVADADTTYLAIPKPRDYFLATWRRILVEQGLQIDAERIESFPATETQTLVAMITSPPLSTLIKTTNQESNNLYAETLHRQLARLGPPTQDPWAQPLQQLGISSTAYALRDGSGLSRHNLASPQLFTQVLQNLQGSQWAEVYKQSLPVAGQTGTLKSRFLNTELVGNLAAKTGTLAGVVSLSGYLSRKDASPLTFSMMVNNARTPLPELRQALDTILGWAYQTGPCP